MSVIGRIQKRLNGEAEIEGVKVHLRSLSYIDGLAMDSIANDHLKTFYALGCSLLEDSGVRAYERGDTETAEEFGARVMNSLPDISSDSISQLMAAIVKLTKPPNVSAIEKNSEPTATPAS